MSAQRFCEARAFVQVLAQLGEHAHQLLFFDLIGQRRDRIDQRHAGSDQRGKLSRHDRDVARAGAAEPSQEVELALVLVLLLLVLFGGQREQHAFFAQRAAQSLGVVGVAKAFDRLAGGNLNSAKFVDGHASAHSSITTSSCVAATTSSTVVLPSSTLRAPSSRMVSMPWLMAARLMLCASALARM